MIRYTELSLAQNGSWPLFTHQGRYVNDLLKNSVLQAYLFNSPVTVSYCSELSCFSDVSLSRVILQNGHCDKLHIHLNDFMCPVSLGVIIIIIIKRTKPCHARFTSYVNGWSVMGQSVKRMTYTEIPRFKSRFGYRTTFSPVLQSCMLLPCQ